MTLQPLSPLSSASKTQRVIVCHPDKCAYSSVGSALELSSSTGSAEAASSSGKSDIMLLSKRILSYSECFFPSVPEKMTAWSTILVALVEDFIQNGAIGSDGNRACPPNYLVVRPFCQLGLRYEIHHPTENPKSARPVNWYRGIVSINLSVNSKYSNIKIILQIMVQPRTVKNVRAVIYSPANGKEGSLNNVSRTVLQAGRR